jgi:hypothetical protein
MQVDWLIVLFYCISPLLYIMICAVDVETATRPKPSCAAAHPGQEKREIKKGDSAILFKVVS